MTFKSPILFSKHIWVHFSVKKEVFIPDKAKAVFHLSLWIVSVSLFWLNMRTFVIYSPWIFALSSSKSIPSRSFTMAQSIDDIPLQSVVSHLVFYLYIYRLVNVIFLSKVYRYTKLGLTSFPLLKKRFASAQSQWVDLEYGYMRQHKRKSQHSLTAWLSCIVWVELSEVLAETFLPMKSNITLFKFKTEDHKLETIVLRRFQWKHLSLVSCKLSKVELHDYSARVFISFFLSANHV